MPRGRGERNQRASGGAANCSWAGRTVLLQPSITAGTCMRGVQLRKPPHGCSPHIQQVSVRQPSRLQRGVASTIGQQAPGHSPGGASRRPPAPASSAGSPSASHARPCAACTPRVGAATKTNEISNTADPHLLRGLPIQVVHQPQVQLLALLAPVRRAHQQPTVAAAAHLQAAVAAPGSGGGKTGRAGNGAGGNTLQGR